MKSFGILRTNPGLTTNLKIMVGSDYSLSLDSIDSTPELSSSKFKKVEFNKDNYFDELIPYFYDGLPAELAYYIKYDDDADSMTQNFADQFDEIYQYGARNITNNKNYTEEFEYFAPLYIQKKRLPKYFVVFRVDGPGLIRLDRTNFKEQVLKKFKVVSLFDLGKTSKLGEWLYKNIDDNEFFPNTPFEMNYDTLDFSIWKGINYASGGFVDKSQFLDDSFEQEKEVFEMDRFIFDGYRSNKVVFPNILNFSFLFDDTPADENGLKKWSINRYYGFYIEDLEKVTTISPYRPPAIKSNSIVLPGNILESDGDPFVGGYRTDVPMYVEYDGEYYRVEKFTELSTPSVSSVKKSVTSKTSEPTTKGPNVQISMGNLIDMNDPVSQDYLDESVVQKEVERWRIISDLNLAGKQAYLNSGPVIFDSDKKIQKSDGTKFNIIDFDRSDVWLIEVDGKYHNLTINSSGEILINTDYGFSFSDNSYSYFINSNDPSHTTTVSTLVDFNNKPKNFPIYRVKFSSIKDFDTRIVETEPSKFEYELSDDITKTEETKLYFTDLNSLTIPQRLDNFYFKDKVVNIPVSSEYTSNQETFKIDGGQLSPIWRKNTVYCRWGYESSLSANDYPYTLNNSSVFEDFNRTTNTFDSEPKRTERNLDYFYTINTSTYSYTHHSLHLERSIDGGIDTTYDFDFDYYTGKKVVIGATGGTYFSDFDYFENMFTMKSAFNRNKEFKNSKKYSEFIAGDSETPNYTLFRGIKFSIQDVENIKLNENNAIDTINTIQRNTFENYRFSIILTSSDNGMRWDIIERWDLEKSYRSGDIVVHDDILYIAIKDTSNKEPFIKRTKTVRSKNSSGSVAIYEDLQETVIPAPYNTLHYSLSNPAPLGIVLINSLKYDSSSEESNDWAFYTDTSVSDQPSVGQLFWNPIKALQTNNFAYKLYDIVYRHGSYFYYKNDKGTIDFWNPVFAMKVNQNQRLGYTTGTIVIHMGKTYRSKVDGNIKPPTDSNWEEVQDSKSVRKWSPVEIWQPNKQYGGNFSVVVHDGILYRSTSNTDLILSGTVPSKSPLWTRMYSLEPDTNFVYTNKLNPYLIQNGEIYRMVSNPRLKTLENGVRIFINHKYKNILVNIFVNDNTTENVKNSERDLLYKKINRKLVAKNFIDHINGISSLNGFSDHLTYIVISEDGTSKSYNYTNNITSLPHVIFAEGPEELVVQPNSLDYVPSNEIRLKATKSLKESRITNLNELNYYNNTHMAVEIIQSEEQPFVTNINPDNKIFRFSGNYMPIFYEIELFNKNNSIEFSTIDLMIEISDKQKVIFDIKNFDIGSQSTYNMLPGKSFSTSLDYYKQIIDVISERVPEVEFAYEIKHKKKDTMLSEVFSLDESSYNEELATWYNPGKNEGYARPILSNTSPKYIKTDLYPGNHFQFQNSFQNKSVMATTLINVSGSNRAFEFVVSSSNVFKYSTFMGNGTFFFGFQDNRVFGKFNTIPAGQGINFQTDPSVVVYSKAILQPNTWYHIVFNVTSTKKLINAATVALGGLPFFQFSTRFNVYIDGVDRTELAALSNPNPVRFPNTTTKTNRILSNINTSFGIGSFYDMSTAVPPFTDPFDGKIYSVRVHSDSLTSEKIYKNFVDEHNSFSIKYRSDKAKLKISLLPEYPTLTLNISDTFDPAYPYFALVMGATGGNEPYQYSFNNSAFSNTTTYTTIPKNGSYNITVRDVLGLTSSVGYYTINSVIEEKYKLSDKLIY